MSSPPPAATRPPLLVWDLPTRLFHWLLVLLLIANYLTAKVWPSVDMHWHKLGGYTILGLLLFRLAWGVVGSRHARFANFVKGPRAILAYLRTLPRRDAPAHIGHNPLGALSVLALFACLLLQVATGLFADDEILAQGPLAPLADSELRSLASAIHAINFNVLLALVALHLLAVLYYVLWKRQPLVRAMVTGRRRNPVAGEAVAAPAMLRWLVVAAVAVGLVLVIVLGLPAWLAVPGGGGGGFSFD